MAKSKTAHRRSQAARRRSGAKVDHRRSRWQRLWQSFWHIVIANAAPPITKS